MPCGLILDVSSPSTIFFFLAYVLFFYAAIHPESS